MTIISFRYDIKHIAYIAGPFSHMQKARDTAHDIIERLGLGPDRTFSFSTIGRVSQADIVNV
jgi:hypothetical protein